MKAQRKLKLAPPPAIAGQEIVPSPGEDRFILAAALVVSFSGVAYELLLATYATYLWGGSIFQYSLVFSSMMLSMGVGSWLSDRGKASPGVRFVVIECFLAALGVVCLPLLYTAYWKGFAPLFFTFGFSLAFGFLVGVEIPLLNRWLGREKKISELLSVDFAGGFLGGILFPLFLVPHLGLFRVAALVALLNAMVALLGSRLAIVRAATSIQKSHWLQVFAIAVCLFGLGFLFWANEIQSWMQYRFFGF